MSDLRLLRDVIAWGRANGWRPADRKDWPFRNGRGRYWTSSLGTVGFDIAGFGQDRIRTVWKDGWGDVGFETVWQAVNLLHDFGVLPVEFHSAYQAGRVEVCTRIDRALGRRPDPETGEPLPCGVEGHQLGRRATAPAVLQPDSPDLPPDIGPHTDAWTDPNEELV